MQGLEIALLFSHRQWENKELEKILDHFIIGKIKTPQQDLEFSVYQMVEIAARALSPGVNDPFTAIACIDNLTAIMVYLADAKFPSKYRWDSTGKLRIIANTFDFEGVLDAAFNQIRQYGGGNTAIIIRLMEALITIHHFAKIDKDRKAIIKHAEMVLRIGKQTIKEQNDLDDLTQRAEKILSD